MRDHQQTWDVEGMRNLDARIRNAVQPLQQEIVNWLEDHRVVEGMRNLDARIRNAVQPLQQEIAKWLEQQEIAKWLELQQEIAKWLAKWLEEYRVLENLDTMAKGQTLLYASPRRR